jgi:hypothetical protein
MPPRCQERTFAIMGPASERIDEVQDGYLSKQDFADDVRRSHSLAMSKRLPLRPESRHPYQASACLKGYQKQTKRTVAKLTRLQTRAGARYLSRAATNFADSDTQPNRIMYIAPRIRLSPP